MALFLLLSYIWAGIVSTKWCERRFGCCEGPVFCGEAATLCIKSNSHFLCRRSVQQQKIPANRGFMA